MYPTLSDGDYALAVKAAEINHNDIVISRCSDGSYIVKRVIALGGEHILIDGKNTYVNDRNIDDQFESFGDIDIVVPDNEVFLMGDNRMNSMDSRMFGPVPLENIKYKLLPSTVVNKWTYSAITCVIVFMLLVFLFQTSKEVKEWEEPVEELQEVADLQEVVTPVQEELVEDTGLVAQALEEQDQV